MNRETKPGDVVVSCGGVYRMYYMDADSKTGMRCMNLCHGESYGDNVSNSSQADHEEFVFNMQDLIKAACADKL